MQRWSPSAATLVRTTSLTSMRTRCGGSTRLGSETPPPYRPSCCRPAGRRVVRRVVLGPTVQRQPRIAAQVERLERTGHPAQVEVAVGGEVHFSPAAAGRLVTS